MQHPDVTNNCCGRTGTAQRGTEWRAGISVKVPLGRGQGAYRGRPHFRTLWSRPGYTLHSLRRPYRGRSLQKVKRRRRLRYQDEVWLSWITVSRAGEKKIIARTDVTARESCPLIDSAVGWAKARSTTAALAARSVGAPCPRGASKRVAMGARGHGAREKRARLCPPFCNGPVEVNPQSRIHSPGTCFCTGSTQDRRRSRSPPDGIRRGQADQSTRTWSQRH